MLDLFDTTTDTPDGVIISIGLLLPDDQGSEAISLSQNLCQEEKCSLVLNVRTNPPRVRLYETVFPKNEVSKVLGLARALAGKMIPFPMRWLETESTAAFVAVWGELNEPLRLFHSAILEALSPLRHGYFKQKYLSPQIPLSREEKASLRRWGSPWAEPYNPHLILAKAKNKFTALPGEVDWIYKKCLLQGVVVGIKENHRLKNIQRILFKSPGK